MEDDPRVARFVSQARREQAYAVDAGVIYPAELRGSLDALRSLRMRSPTGAQA